MITQDLIDRIMSAEGFVATPYRCSAQVLTIGFGHRILDETLFDIMKADGFRFRISRLAALRLLQADIQVAAAAVARIPGASLHSLLRQQTLLEMAFNLGESQMLGFSRMFAALRVPDYPLAAREILDSRAAAQLPSRYARLASQMLKG